MAIDEHDVLTGVADDPGTSEPVTDADPIATDARADRSADDVGRRLGGALYAREPGLNPSVQVPGLRELTWEHVTNPTTSHPVVPGAPMLDGNGVPRPAPIDLEQLLARPEIALSPLEPMPSVFAPISTETPAVAEAPAPPAPPPAPPVAVAPPAPPTGQVMAPPSALPPLTSGSTPTVPPAPAAAPAAASAPVPTGTIEATPAEVHGVDDLVKPIEERPPVARDTDPLISGLAEMILKATPGAGLPLVEEVRGVSRGDTGMVPVVESELTEPPVLDAKVEFANVSTAVPVVPMEPEAHVEHTGVQPATDAVEAEMNRLAFLPDHEDDLSGPVEVPSIAYSDVRNAPAAAPSLAAPKLSVGEQYQPKQSAPIVRHTYADLAMQAAPVAPRRKRHVLRKMVSLVVLLAMVGGGLFAVKYFVLDRVQWSKELAPLVEQVETARGLTFEDEVTVTTLPATDYATRLADSTFGITAEADTAAPSELRALGLMSGAFDAEAVGLAATVDTPAFYDPTDKAIYVVEGVETELYTFSMHRALTAALLDQHFDWGTRLEGQAATVVRGTRALYEGDALLTAQSLVAEADRDTINQQIFASFADLGVTSNPAPFVSVAAGRLGLAVMPYLSTLSLEERNLLEADAAFTDGQVLDLRRLVSSEAATVAEQSQGMLFWYHVLAARVDDDLAWRAALAWQSDETSTEINVEKYCTTGSIVFDAAATDLVTLAFSEWAAKAPAEAATTTKVAPAAGGTVTVTMSACDPGEQAVTNDGALRLSLGGAPLRAEQFRLLMDVTTPPNAEVAACAVYGGDAVSMNDERGMLDASTGWAAPAAHPAPDLAVCAD